MKKALEYGIDAFIIVIAAAWIFAIFILGPEKIVDSIGIQNGYIALLLLGFFSGFTTLDTFLFPPAVMGLVLGGLNPIAAGIFTGTGVAVSNLSFYFFGHGGRKIGEDSQKFKRTTKAVIKWLDKLPSWTVPIFFWFYATAIPLPNAAVIASAGIVDYSFKKTAAAFLLGNITHYTLLSYLAVLGVSLF